MTFLQRHAYAIGCWAAATLWPFFVKRRRISVENILKCKVAACEADARRIAKKSFCHFAGHICEALFASKVVNEANWREHFDFSDADPEALDLLLERIDTPILIVSGHHGCWEAATHIIPFRRPMIAIARVMDNPILRRWMKKHSFRGSVTVISKNNGLNAAVLEQWRRERSALTILSDQHTYGGAMLKFFGRPARTVTSAARLAMRFGVPMVVGSFVRTGPYKYRAVSGKPLFFSKDADRNEATQLINDRLEEAIRKYPEQYLWMHRRWRDD